MKRTHKLHDSMVHVKSVLSQWHGRRSAKSPRPASARKQSLFGALSSAALSMPENGFERLHD